MKAPWAGAGHRHTGLERHTKDFDIFVRPDHCERVLQTLAAAGYGVELTFPHWLGKAFSGDNCIDVIFSSGNGIATVDDGWFAHAIEGRDQRTIGTYGSSDAVLVFFSGADQADLGEFDLQK